MSSLDWASARRFFQSNAIPISFFASALITWPLIAEMELFEAFYEFSRAHEEWDLDEFAMLVVNMAIALLLSQFYMQRRLQRLKIKEEAQRARAEQNARHDPLTGLLNRRAFMAEMDAIARRKDPSIQYGVAMIDLDRFKPINDTFGHAAGDEALIAFADRLQDELDGSATLARLGGDEFALLFDMTEGPDAIEGLARRLLHTSRQAIQYRDHHFHLSCSIGIASWPKAEAGSEALRRSDKALYTAKNLGRDQFSWYDSELDQRSKELSEIETELRSAIANSEIEPWFQPIVDIQNNTLIGFEVLARWHHPTRGQISPAVFIPVAEDSGQINRLDMDLLKRACISAKSWDKPLSISFNLSPHQFHDKMMVEHIKTVIDETGIDPNRLVLEVTESSFIKDFDLARQKLDALKALGVAIALDDFGTGYSSLAMLRQLPFDRIKIDQSFVTNIEDEPQNQKIVAGIMAMASGLELCVTAEGIETAEDLNYVKLLECEFGQGFLFARAVPSSQLDELIQFPWSDFFNGHSKAPRLASAAM